MKLGAGLLRWLFRPIDIASLVYFRVLFGGLMFVLIAGRLLFLFKMDWIRHYYLDPPILFKYYGFAWVQPWPGHWLKSILCSWLLRRCW